MRGGPGHRIRRTAAALRTTTGPDGPAFRACDQDLMRNRKLNTQVANPRYGGRRNFIALNGA